MKIRIIMPKDFYKSIDKKDLYPVKVVVHGKNKTYTAIRYKKRNPDKTKYNKVRNKQSYRSGAITDIESKRARRYAKKEYESIRKRKVDVERIAKNTGYSKEEIQKIKNYLFIDKHDLGYKDIERFDPSFDIAQSWNRLMNGNIKKHDLTLLKHEIYERKLISNGLSQEQAHKETCKIYNYQKEAEEYYAKIKKRNKK